LEVTRSFLSANRISTTIKSLQNQFAGFFFTTQITEFDLIKLGDDVALTIIVGFKHICLRTGL